MEVVHLFGVKDTLFLAPLIRIAQNQMQIYFALAVRQVFLYLQKLCPAHQLIHPAHPQLRHVFPQFLGNKSHKVLHILRLSLKALPQFRILCGNAHRAGIQVADPHHHTA